MVDCPVCGTILALRDGGLGPGTYRLHLVVRGALSGALRLPPLEDIGVGVLGASAVPLAEPSHSTVSVDLEIADGSRLTPARLDTWWWSRVAPALHAEHAAARPSRPGYFVLSYDNSHDAVKQCDFDVYCPNPHCELASQPWTEQAPVRRDAEQNGIGQGGTHTSTGYAATPPFQALPNVERLQWQPAPAPFVVPSSRGGRITSRVPVPALTVDDQVYRRLPSFVMTVDKFARLAFEPDAAAIFGNVTHYHSRWGYYREGSPPLTSLPSGRRMHPPGFNAHRSLHVPAGPFDPPGLVIQDELHLLEGPLGSMVGLYETVIDALTSAHGRRAKYLASTATIREAASQVEGLFVRRLCLFPPSAVSSDDRFFAVTKEAHPFVEGPPGRVYVGISAPGKGPQTPLIRVWASLLQAAGDLAVSRGFAEVDDYWTLVGYFNAVRELAGAKALYRQDIPSRLQLVSATPRDLGEEGVELSGRQASTELPAILETLGKPAPDGPVAVFATSMFGTGVDVSRLGLMVVNAQPKTTSAYIQAAGCVGRRRSGLVVTFLRASCPRDLDHYEFFVGYHRAIYRHVEPVTIAPFSPGARDRGLGPVAVSLLRQAREIDGVPVDPMWRIEQRLTGQRYDSEAPRMRTNRTSPDAASIPGFLEARAQAQPAGRRPIAGVVEAEVRSELDRWEQLAAKYPSGNDLIYAEYAVNRLPTRAVVLGDAHHPAQGLEEAFENAPQSLREVEDSTTFFD